MFRSFVAFRFAAPIRALSPERRRRNPGARADDPGRVMACVLSALLASCGGGGESGSSSQPPAPPPPPQANRPPVVTIATPATGNSFAEGEEVRLEGSALDPEDGQLAGTGLVWTLTSGDALGTGESLVISTLARGTQTIELTATDSNGARATTSVSIRITEPAAPAAARAGETNPYAGRIQRTVVKRDDEIVLIGRASAADQLVYGIVDEPISRYEFAPNATPVPPRITQRRSAVAPVAGAAGRILHSNLHQAAVVTRTTTAPAQFRLEIVGLSDPGEDALATLAFAPPIPAGVIEVAVADLDAFEEVGGAKARTAPTGRNSEYHDEVTLAYAEAAGGELRARIRVLSFEDVEFPELREGQVPGPTSEVSALTSVAMLPTSRFVIAHGDALFGSRPGPHLVVAYLDTARRVAIDVFEYRHTRADPDVPDPRTDSRSLPHVLHAVLTTPLTEAAAIAGGWDVVVGNGLQLGMENPLSVFDLVMVVRHSNGLYLQNAWKLEDLDGTDVPELLASSSDEFARVSDGAGGEIPLAILPNSRLRAVLGRVVDPEPNRCEAVGLLVLADTNRGPVVQSMSAFISDPFVGSFRFGPLTQRPPWLSMRAETTQTTNTLLAAGGLVSERNGLIDDRGNPSGVFTEFAQDCQGASSGPFLGPMPSFYVAEPELSQLSAVTMLLGSSGGGSYVTTSMDATIDQLEVLLAADANGDAAYYAAFNCVDGPTSQCRRLFLGDADLHYTLENVETQNVVLQQPPKHVDFLRGLGGIVDVSMRDDYFAEFAQTSTSSGSINRKLKTDWSLGVRLGIGLGPSVPPDKDFKPVTELSLDVEHRSVQEQFAASQVTVSLSQTTGAVDDDVVWSKIQTTDFWRFPVQGGKADRAPNSPSALPKDAYLEIAVPGEPVTSIGPGSLSDAYQPSHQVGNILSYPTIDGSVQDIGELFDYLGSYVPTDEAGTRECKPASDTDPNGCIVLINGLLQQVAQVLAGDQFIAGEFQSLTNPVDVAEVLQVGGISYAAELTFDTNVQRGQTVTNNDTIKANLDTKLPIKGKAVTAEVSAQIRASASFENASISENSLGSQTRIALHVPASIPIQRSYRVRPSFGFTPGGSLLVSYQVSTEGAAATFWEQHYAAPDPALNLPYRIVRSPNGFELNSDFSRNRMKGFFVRDGAGIDPTHPGATVGPLLVAAPSAGDPVQLEVRVLNLSVASPVSGLTVEFAAQAYENGNPVGQLLPLGESTIDFLPYRGEFADAPNGHVASAYLIWDTTSFAPSSGEALKDYLIYVTLDPGNRIGNETHELMDRFNDPLKGPLDAVIDPGLEKGQNNRGWALVRVAPSLALASTVSKSEMGSRPGKLSRKVGRGEPVRLSLEGSSKPGALPRLSGKARESLRLSIGLHSEHLSRDHGVLQVFDGDPDLGAEMVASRTVQGLAGGEPTIEQIE